jgi:malate synthase A
VDFGLYFFHNAQELLGRGNGPYFYLPKTESHRLSTCHRRAAFAIGGRAASIPSRRDAEFSESAFAEVREDKEREVGDGFDGSWVAHPDLVPICQEVSTKHLGDRPNQLDVRRDDVQVTAAQLLDVSAVPGTQTEAGLRNNVDVGLRYLEAWLGGNGAVGIHNLMEDAATAEISRSQVWQWVHNNVRLDTGETVSAEFVRRILDEELWRRSARRSVIRRTAPADSMTRDSYSNELRWRTTLLTSLPCRRTRWWTEARSDRR